jgi:TPR repeat protein
MLVRIVLAAALSVVALVPPLQAGFKEGVDAVRRGDFKVALQEIKPLAERGHLKAQFYLGVMYANGYGVEQDDTEAVKWYARAAEQNDARAQYSLGIMYAEGKGGLERDYTEAVQWYRLAAAQGLARAMNNLGAMYEFGAGAPRDLGKAYAWYDLAAKRSRPGAEKDQAARNRESLGKRLSPPQLERAKAMALNWSEGGSDDSAARSASTRPSAPASSASRSLVARVQNALAAAGYDPGPVDGLMGDRTRHAIRAFQASHDLPVTGELSAELLPQIEKTSAR